MAVVGFAELRPSTGEGELEADRQRIEQVYLVRTDDLLDDATVVTSATGLPIVGYPYSPDFDTLRARRYSAKRISPASLFWEVTVEFSTPETKSDSSKDGGDGSGGTGKENDDQFSDPTQEYPTVKFDTASREVLITQVVDTLTGAVRPPCATNGEVYDPPPKRLQRYATLEISRNEPLTGDHPALGITYQDAVNSDTFWGMDPGTWQCKKITAELQIRQLPGGDTTAYLKVVYQFEAAGTWDILLLDYGTTYLVQSSPPGSPAVRRRFRTADGHETAGPLNGRGGALIQNVVCTMASSLVTLTGTPFTINNGQIVQFTTINGALPSPIVPGAGYYVINASGSTFQISLTSNGSAPGGTAISFGASSPDCYVSQPAVYNTIRPYPWLPFSALDLPQSFEDQVQ